MKVTKVEIPQEELAEYREFQRANKLKKEKLAKEIAMKDYKEMVNSEINESAPFLLKLSDEIMAAKKKVFDNFKAVLELKSSVLHLTKSNQRSHTFTNTQGTLRITLGRYTKDDYDDTADDGINKVQEYIQSLASDEKTKSLVSMVLRLLARDQAGALKASRVLQLRKMANDSGNKLFIEGVELIENSYQPTLSKSYIKVETKSEDGAWKAVPLGMTEA